MVPSGSWTARARDAGAQRSRHRRCRCPRAPCPSSTSRRICAIRSASSASASGSFMGAREEGLQDMLGGDLVEHFLLAPPAHARLGERETRCVRGQPLVDEIGVDAEALRAAAGQNSGSAATTRARCRRDAPASPPPAAPAAIPPPDARCARSARCPRLRASSPADGRCRARAPPPPRPCGARRSRKPAPYRCVATRRAAGRLGCGLIGDIGHSASSALRSRMSDIVGQARQDRRPAGPSRQRTGGSAGRLKITSTSAATVSQAFWVSSCSSWPGAQPA